MGRPSSSNVGGDNASLRRSASLDPAGRSGAGSLAQRPLLDGVRHFVADGGSRRDPRRMVSCRDLNTGWAASPHPSRRTCCCRTPRRPWSARQLRHKRMFRDVGLTDRPEPPRDLRHAHLLLEFARIIGPPRAAGLPIFCRTLPDSYIIGRGADRCGVNRDLVLHLDRPARHVTGCSRTDRDARRSCRTRSRCRPRPRHAREA